MKRWLMGCVALLSMVVQVPAMAPVMDDPVLEDMIDLALLRAVELAHGILQRKIPPEAWEARLQELEQELCLTSGMEPDEAGLIVDTARKLLREHGNNPALLQSMLDDMG